MRVMSVVLSKSLQFNILNCFNLISILSLQAKKLFILMHIFKFFQLTRIWGSFYKKAYVQ